MKKRVTTGILAAIMTLSMNITSFASGWQQDQTGWWWQRENGTYPTNCWEWIDGNGDGTAECYYFNSSGYMLENTVAPDGYTVNASGAWTVNGVVQTKNIATKTAAQNTTGIYGTYKNPYDEIITLSNENGTLILRYYEEKGDEIEELYSEMEKLNDTTYLSTIYDAVIIQFTSDTTFEFYDGMIYTKQN